MKGNNCSNIGASNQVQRLECRGGHLATLNVHGKGPLICLPQEFELSLKHFGGDLHTVKQFRKLRVIRPGLYRCKLIALRNSTFSPLTAQPQSESSRRI